MNILNSEHATELFNDIAEYYVTQQHVDLIFLCKENIEVKTHKMMFSAVSLFLKGMLETNKSDIVYICLPDVDHKKLQILVNFLYEGISKVNLHELISLKEIMSLLDVKLYNTDISSFNLRTNEKISFQIISSAENDSDKYNKTVKLEDWMRNDVENVESGKVKNCMRKTEESKNLYGILLQTSEKIIKDKELMIGSDICKIAAKVTCKICGKMFITAKGISSHSCIKYKRHKCEYCDSSFDNQHHWNAHMNLHMGFKRYKCNMCSWYSHEKIKFDAHQKHCKGIRRKIVNKKLVKGRGNCKIVAKILCELCGKKFISNSSLKIHDCFTYRQFKCDYCDASFDNQEKYDAHIRVHLGIKPYKCSKCSRAFGKKYRRDEHKRNCIVVKNHDHDTTSYMEEMNKNPDNMVHCKICEKMFLNQRSSQVHSCTEYKKFKCLFCDASFTTLYKCERHMRLHKENN